MGHYLEPRGDHSTDPFREFAEVDEKDDREVFLSTLEGSSKVISIYFGDVPLPNVGERFKIRAEPSGVELSFTVVGVDEGTRRVKFQWAPLENDRTHEGGQA
jgi:hypothetical protein